MVANIRTNIQATLARPQQPDNQAFDRILPAPPPKKLGGQVIVAWVQEYLVAMMGCCQYAIAKKHAGRTCFQHAFAKKQDDRMGTQQKPINLTPTVKKLLR
jgi:hypothetical protein